MQSQLNSDDNHSRRLTICTLKSNDDVIGRDLCNYLMGQNRAAVSDGRNKKLENQLGVTAIIRAVQVST